MCVFAHVYGGVACGVYCVACLRSLEWHMSINMRGYLYVYVCVCVCACAHVCALACSFTSSAEQKRSGMSQHGHLSLSHCTWVKQRDGSI